MSKDRQEQSESLGTKPVGRLLLEFGTPSIIAMSASSIYNICDSIFIGHKLGALAIAGMTITFPLVNILTAFRTIAIVGGSAQASIHMGRKERHTVHNILGNVLFLNFVFALVLGAIGLTFLDEILSLFGASDQTLPYARPYMKVVIAGALLSFVFQSLCNMMRATGYPRAAMKAQLLAVILNIALDALFIIVFDWGIKGAAFATIAAQGVALLYILPHYRDRRSYLFLSRSVLNVSWHYIREICSIGISPFLSNISGCLIVAVVNHTLLLYGSDMYVGAYGITNRITQLLIMMVAGFSQGLQPIVGYNLGAGQYDRVRSSLRKAIVMASIITTVGYLFIAIVPDHLARLFTDEPQMIHLCVPALRIALFTFPLVGSQMIAVSFFQSVRKAKFSVFISLSRQLLCLLPMLLLLPPVVGVEGVWWSMSLADIYSVLISWVLLYRIMRNIDSIRLK